MSLLLAAAPAEAADGGGLEFIEIALIIFFLVFVGITTWVLMVRKGGFNAQARIPLSDEPVTPRDPAERSGRPDPSPDRPAEDQR